MPRRKKNSSENTNNSTSFYGINIEVGDCLKIVLGRYCYYLQVEQISPENPTVVIGRDIYGKVTVIRLTKALIIAKIPREEFERKKRW